MHGALRCAGAAGGVDQQRQRVVLVGDEHRCGRQRLPAVEHVGQRFHTHRAARLRQPRPGGVERLALVVHLGVVVEDDQPRGRVPGQRQFNGIVQIVTLAAITFGSVSATMGRSCVTGALVCSGTHTAPVRTNATSMIV